MCYCLALLKFLLEFYYIFVWFLGYYSTFLGLLFRANILNFLFCLTPLTLLFDFFWVAIWFLLGCSYPCYSNFLLLFNTSNIIIWPNVIQLVSKCKTPFWFSSHVRLLLLALFFGFSCDVAYQLNIAPNLFCADLGMKNLDPIHQVIFSIISNLIYKLASNNFVFFCLDVNVVCFNIFSFPLIKHLFMFQVQSLFVLFIIKVDSRAF